MNNLEPPVSVFIITRLEDEHRCEVLRSVCRNALEQNYSTLEVVVSDNVGTIHASEALASINDPRLKVFRNEKNLGFAGNMNCCLDRCQYDIIKLNCDDDLMHQDFLRVTVPYVDDNTFVIADIEQYKVGNEPASIKAPLPENIETEIREPGYRKDFWTFDYISLPVCTIFTKELYRSLGGYDIGSVLGDWHLLMEARLRRRVVYVKHTLSYMGVWKGSLTEQMNETRPFFFPTGKLYTKFKYANDKALPANMRADVRCLLVGDLLKNTLRLMKRFYQRNYREGYRDYCTEYFRCRREAGV